MIRQRIKELKEVMRASGIDMYIIPSEDFHQSEYVGEYFKARAFISGFTGSAGTVVVTQGEACLWTDGRYFLQAGKQLAGTGIRLQKMGEPGVPSVAEYVADQLPEGGTLGFDGRVVSLAAGRELEDIVREKSARINSQRDLIDEIWLDRPDLSKEKAFFLNEGFSGERSASKVARIREKMREYHADTHIIAALDDICWMLNIRGNDVRYSPLVLSYAIITLDEVHLFAEEEKFNDEIRKSLAEVNAVIHPYNAVYEKILDLTGEETVLLDPRKVNYRLFSSIPDAVKIVEGPNPAILFKAVKNETELENIRTAQIKDGIAWARFMQWLKSSAGNAQITEMDASDRLEAYRKEQTDYLWPSFAPISGYGPNGAIVHYEATGETNAVLERKGFYLSDTGANYLQGSTDITRTLALGELTREEKLHFTTVLKSHIQLATARFLQGTSGFALDILARRPMWDLGLDYKHGTGHGVGYLLNVHEGPSGFRYRIDPAKDEGHPLEPGMLLSNEPGIYREGRYGIRLENLMIVTAGEENEYGRFLHFELCTWVPIDLDAVDADLLTGDEKEFLNRYHRKVYEMISPHLNETEREWLTNYTRQI